MASLSKDQHIHPDKEYTSRYNISSVAPAPVYEPEKRPRRRKLAPREPTNPMPQATARRRIKRGFVAQMFILLTFSLGVGCVLLMQYEKISAVTRQVNRLRDEIDAYNTAYTTNQVALEFAMDIEQAQKAAAKMGMAYPGEDQIVEIDYDALTEAPSSPESASYMSADTAPETSADIAGEDEADETLTAENAGQEMKPESSPRESSVDDGADGETAEQTFFIPEEETLDNTEAMQNGETGQ